MVIRYNGITIDREKRTVSHNKKSYTFSCVRRRKVDVTFRLLLHLVCGPGLSVTELFNLIYADDPDGGPLEGPHILLVNLNQLEKRVLAPLDLEWRAWRLAGVNFYCVVPKYQLPDPKHRVMFKNLYRQQRYNDRLIDV